MMSFDNVIIVEGYRSPQEVMEDGLLCYEDKLRILEKWNQIYIIKAKVFPEHSNSFQNAQQKVIKLVNCLVEMHMHLHDPELMID